MPRNFSQSSSQFLASLDAEIERLQNLRGQVAAAVEADETVSTPAKSARKGMSAKGRRRIAEAQKARWAKQKQAVTAAAKEPAKKAAKKTSMRKSTPAKKSPSARKTEQA